MSFYWLDLFHEIRGSDKKNGEWDKLFFRDEEDYYCGILSHYSPIFLIFIEKFENDVQKHFCYEEILRGVDLFENLAPLNKDNAKRFRKHGKIINVSIPHKQYAKIRGINIADIDIEGERKKQELDYKNFKKNTKKYNKKNLQYFYPLEKHGFENWYKLTKNVPLMLKDDNQIEAPFFTNHPKVLAEHDKFIEKTLNKWMKMGSIELIPENETPLLVTPLVLAALTRKPRICHDGTFIKLCEANKNPCVLDSLFTFVPTIEMGSRIAVSDDRNGFHLIRLNEESRSLTAFYYKNRFFRYRAAQFGIPKIPGSYQRINAAAVNYARFFGYQVALYLDDRAICEIPLGGVFSDIACFSTMLLVVASGSIISLDKSNLTPKFRQKYLGMNLDGEKCEISVPEDKFINFSKDVNQILEKGSCYLNHLEKIRGRCVSYQLACPLMRLFIRQQTECITKAYREGNNMITVTPELRVELNRWLESNIIQYSQSWLPKKIIHSNTVVSFSDSSNMAVGWVIHESPGKTISKTRYFEEKFHERIIAIKEAIAILKMLEQNENLFKNKHIVHYCDNMNVCYAYQNQGTSNTALNEFVTNIYIKLHEINSTLNIYWVSTRCMSADLESRTIIRSEEFMPMKFFKDLEIIFNLNFTIDGMATLENKKCHRYCSLYHEVDEGLIDINFFNCFEKFDASERVFLFPPKKILDRTCIFLRKTKLKVLLFFHRWMELPMGITILRAESNLYRIPDNCYLSYFPSEHFTEIESLYNGKSKISGVPNTRRKSSYILTLNIEKIEDHPLIVPVW